jgi:hypothetical protein
MRFVKGYTVVVIDLHEEQPEPFRVTPGFIAFVAAMCLPLLIALVVYTGAAFVASDVREAEASVSQEGGVQTNVKHVDGWKKSLVEICPLH